ncbi:MAG TPA: ABC transporter substrate-binding protein [Nocardioides sp.]|nr:ABC transporter substrate-binding protein [Nocardioides sp.]
MKIPSMRLKGGVAVVAVLAFAGVGAACSPSADDDGGGGPVQNPDVLAVATDDEPEGLDPAGIEDNGLGRTAVLSGYDRLLDIDPAGTDLIPSVATEVPSLDNGGISEDGLTYTFNLRDDVKFHDGSDLTAEDVVYSWERVITMNLPEGQAENFSTIDSMDAPDATTFVVTLTQIDASFLYNVVASMPASIVNPDVVEANGGVQADTPNEFMSQNMAGSGQYILTSWERGERLNFEVNDDYWGEKAKMDLRWFNVQDPNVSTLGLRAGDYDMIEGVPSIIPDVEGASGVTLNPDTPGLQLLQIGFNMDIPVDELPEGDDIPADFFHDKRVRQAFNYSFDYDAMREGALSGASTRGSFFIPEGMYGHDPDAPIYDYDPAEAERLFKETGWWDQGFTVSIVAEEDSSFTDQALILKDGIEALNPDFHINVMALPESRFDEIMATSPIPAALWSWTTPEFRDPHSYFMDSAHPDGRWGVLAGLGAGYENPDEIATMIEAANQELDLDARAELYAELQQVMYDEAPSLLPAQENLILAYRDWLTDVVANPMWPRPGLRYSLYGKG